MNLLLSEVLRSAQNAEYAVELNKLINLEMESSVG